MKKLIFVFVALFTVVLIAGCGARQNTVRFNNEETSNEEVNTDNNEGGSEEMVEAEEGETEEVEEVDSEESEEMEEGVMTEAEEVEEVVATVPTGKLAVTSMEGAHLKTNLSYNVIKGTAPSDTYKITINGYKLQKYIPGQTQWDYIAATRFGSLAAGTNNYVLKSFDKDGEETASLMFTIEYDAPSIPEELPNVGSSHWLALLMTMISVASYAVFRKLKWL